MLRKTFTLGITFLLFTVLTASARIWRVNNNAGVAADFTTFNAAATAATAGDTIHLEPSATSYATSSFNLTKRLVVIGVGYFLDPANTTTPGNAGLQATTNSSRLDFFRIQNGANSSRFLGVTFDGGFYIGASATAYNLSFEKCLFNGSNGFYFETAGNYDGIAVRKCFFNNTTISAINTAVISNFICENTIFNGSSSYINLPVLTGTGNIIRNNSVINNFGSVFTLANAYVANNIFGTPSPSSFTNCVIKNNLFQANQSLPGTATDNKVNVNMSTVYVGGTTGSLDSRAVLIPGTPATNPAIEAGLSVGTVIKPDCGAFGATDPYKLSGIPNIPSIYTFTVPISIPAGTANMNVTISTRNNN
ncbi:MAG: hypothetical protein K2X48_12665 [Chitinophagaceae bacterium]|nr:hypothetical protein [Chitinophagaceae bacterium]